MLASQELLSWCAQEGIPLAAGATLTLIAGGRSNLTYRLEDVAGAQYVLRRPPQGHVLASAHDVGREHRVISALRPTDVPVPHALGLCTDVAVLGAPFYVMNLVPGVVLASDADGAAYPPQARGPVCVDHVRVLTAIHSVDVDAVGLGALGKREDYCVRQLRRWRRQFLDSDPRDLPLVEEVHDRLAASIPPQRHTGLVHGDYRLGNTLVGASGQVEAVLDWELAALGDTMADLGWMTAHWREPGEEELLESPTGHAGYWSRSDLVAEYHRVTGRDVSDIGWYQAFALWRLMCIGEGIYSRYRSGAMAEDGFDVEAQGRLVLRLGEAARDALERLRC